MMTRWFRSFVRWLSTWELRLFSPSIVVRAGQEYDLPPGRYKSILIEKDGVLNIVGPFSCYRFENRGRVYKFRHTGLFRCHTFVIEQGSFHCIP